jgi:hypothetical protein
MKEEMTEFAYPTEFEFGSAEEEQSRRSCIPADDYTVELTSWTAKRSAQKGTPMVNVVLKVVEHEEHSGRTIFEGAAFGSQMFRNLCMDLASPAEVAGTKLSWEDLEEGSGAANLSCEFFDGLLTSHYDVQVAIRKGNDAFPEDRNTIRRYMRTV